MGFYIIKLIGYACTIIEFELTSFGYDRFSSGDYKLKDTEWVGLPTNGSKT